MKCPNCKRIYDENFKFCPYCGFKKPTLKICPNCELETYKEFSFCPECGKRLKTEEEYELWLEHIRIKELREKEEARREKLREIVYRAHLNYRLIRKLITKIDTDKITDKYTLNNEIKKAIEKEEEEEHKRLEEEKRRKEERQKKEREKVMMKNYLKDILNENTSSISTFSKDMLNKEIINYRIKNENDLKILIQSERKKKDLYSHLNVLNLPENYKNKIRMEIYENKIRTKGEINQKENIFFIASEINSGDFKNQKKYTGYNYW